MTKTFTRWKALKNETDYMEKRNKTRQLDRMNGQNKILFNFDDVIL
jgi:hypothetical protein